MAKPSALLTNPTPITAARREEAKQLAFDIWEKNVTSHTSLEASVLLAEYEARVVRLREALETAANRLRVLKQAGEQAAGTDSEDDWRAFDDAYADGAQGIEDALTSGS
jgi:hypothetical protein